MGGDYQDITRGTFNFVNISSHLDNLLAVGFRRTLVVSSMPRQTGWSEKVLRTERYYHLHNVPAVFGTREPSIQTVCDCIHVRPHYFSIIAAHAGFWDK